MIRKKSRLGVVCDYMVINSGSDGCYEGTLTPAEPCVICVFASFWLQKIQTY